QPTTPAQMFHLLRGQVLRRQRSPLIVMTPKSLLRLPAATSTLDELSGGRFQRVIPDNTVDPEKVTRVVMCTGKIYYELGEAGARGEAEAGAMGRREKLPPRRPSTASGRSEKARPLRGLRWGQGEPISMDAAGFVMPRLEQLVRNDVKRQLIGRAESASAAT